MAQDPNIPKLKISEACLSQVDPLIQLIDLITGAENWLACAKQNPESASARRSLALKTVGEIRSTGDFEADLLNTIESELQSAGMYEFTGYPLRAVAHLRKSSSLRAVAHLRKSKMKAFEALLNAAVDCECREAKAAYDKLSSEALQTVIEGKGEHDGRPRRYTEIPGEE